MMSLDFVTNATTVKSRLSREAGNATNVKSPLRREEGMTTQVKSFHHHDGHPEGTHATDDKSYLNGRQGSNDVTDVKSSQHGRLGSTELLSSICNKFPLSRDATDVKSPQHGRLGSTDVISAPTDTEDTYLSATLTSENRTFTERYATQSDWETPDTSFLTDIEELFVDNTNCMLCDIYSGYSECHLPTNPN